jgi:hypothetical protein
MSVKQNIKIALSRYVSGTMLGLKTTIKSTIVLVSTVIVHIMSVKLIASAMIMILNV